MADQKHTKQEGIPGAYDITTRPYGVFAVKRTGKQPWELLVYGRSASASHKELEELVNWMPNYRDKTRGITNGLRKSSFFSNAEKKGLRDEYPVLAERIPENVESIVMTYVRPWTGHWDKEGALIAKESLQAHWRKTLNDYPTDEEE